MEFIWNVLLRKEIWEYLQALQALVWIGNGRKSTVTVCTVSFAVMKFISVAPSLGRSRTLYVVHKFMLSVNSEATSTTYKLYASLFQDSLGDPVSK